MTQKTQSIVLAVFSALLCACSPDDLQLSSSDVDGISWRGLYETIEGCTDGEVELHVTETAPGWFQGRYNYVSLGNSGSYANYLVEGELLGGHLVLDQVDAEEGPLPEGWNWCYGTMSLAIDPEDGVISGDWQAPNCNCAGEIVLTE